MILRVLISGNVQGVSFRASTKRKADELGLKGFVRNLADGKVEAEFSGAKERIENMLVWIKGWHLGAKLEHCDEVSGKAYKGFEIRYYS